MSKSDSIASLAGALARAQAQLENAQKTRLARVATKAGGEYRYTYTTLADVYDVCREPLAANGLSIAQLPTDADGDRVALTTILMHESGEYIATTSSMPVADRTPQAVGSALTYLRRYHLVSLIGVAVEDDDGAQGSGKQTQHDRIARQERPQALAMPALQARATTDDTADAEAKFYAHLGDAIDAIDWPDVQAWLGTKAPKPTTVDGWREAYKLVKTTLAQRQAAPAAPAAEAA